MKQIMINSKKGTYKIFDPKARANQNVITGLKLLTENAVSIATPDIGMSMNAVRDARNARNARDTRNSRDKNSR
ncbi:MAG: hypothetical protein HC782_02040 [Gammaproteobacteria bacterium]|nr:hypothetical protein [Gammaproteobacteria bacterium]